MEPFRLRGTQNRIHTSSHSSRGPVSPHASLPLSGLPQGLCTAGSRGQDDHSPDVHTIWPLFSLRSWLQSQLLTQPASKATPGLCLDVQWLTLHLPMLGGGVQVQSLDLGSHLLGSAATNFCLIKIKKKSGFKKKYLKKSSPKNLLLHQLVLPSARLLWPSERLPLNPPWKCMLHESKNLDHLLSRGGLPLHLTYRRHSVKIKMC